MSQINCHFLLNYTVKGMKFSLTCISLDIGVNNDGLIFSVLVV